MLSASSAATHPIMFAVQPEGVRLVPRLWKHTGRRCFLFYCADDCNDASLCCRYPTTRMTGRQAQ